MKSLVDHFARVVVAAYVAGTAVNALADEPWPDLLGADATLYSEVQSIEVVGSEGYLLEYRITTAESTENVLGSTLARQRLREAVALPALREISGTSAYATGMEENVTGPFQFLGNLATRPIETTENLGRGLGRLFQGTAIALPNSGTEQEGSDLEALLTVLAYKRDFAAKVGVDTYSSNDAIQDELDRLGRYGAAGNLTLAVASLPVSGPVKAAVSITGLSGSVHDFVYEQAPSEVRRVSLNSLDEMGVGRGLSEQFVFHPEFTPLHQAIIIAALMELDGVGKRAAFVQAAVTAYDEPSAVFMVEVAQMLAHQHRSREPLVGLHNAGSFVLAETQSGKAVLTMPFDYGAWDDDARAAFALITPLANAMGASSREIWLKGAVSDRARQEAKAAGYTVTENAFREVAWIYPPPLTKRGPTSE